jgi:hypothetical protein
MVYIRESCLELKTTKWKEFAYTVDIFVKTIALCMNIFYVGAQVEFKMSSKHILQNNFQNFEVKTNEIIN